MAELKTKLNDTGVEAFINLIDHEQKRADAFAILKMMQEVTGEEAKMWGSSIIGFGSYQYTYASGREGEWMLIGFSPRKQNLTLYIMPGFGEYDGLLAKLGKHKIGKSCLYVNKLADVDQDVLKELIRLSTNHMRETNS